MNEQLNWFASDLPSSLPTTRSSSKSHLLPTKTIGTSSVSLNCKQLIKLLSTSCQTHLNPQNLLPKILKIVKCRLRCNGIHEDESLSVFHVKIAHRRELLRPGRVKNLEHTLLPIDLHLLSVRVFYRRVVLLYEDALQSPMFKLILINQIKVCFVVHTNTQNSLFRNPLRLFCNRKTKKTSYGSCFDNKWKIKN